MHRQVSTRVTGSALVCLLLKGCSDTTMQYYGPLTLPVDDGNELHKV